MVKSNVQKGRKDGNEISQLDPDGDDVELAHTLTVSRFATSFVAIVFEARPTPATSR